MLLGKSYYEDKNGNRNVKGKLRKKSMKGKSNVKKKSKMPDIFVRTKEHRTMNIAVTPF